MSDAPGAVNGLTVEEEASLPSCRATGQPDTAATRQLTVNLSAGLSLSCLRMSGCRPPSCLGMSGCTPYSGLQDILVFQL